MSEPFLKFGRVAVVANPQKEYGPLLERIGEKLHAAGASFITHLVPVPGSEGAGNRDTSVPDDIDCIITLGGDGTLLYAARYFYGVSIPVLAVNLGTFGFLTEISREEVLDSLDSLLAGTAVIQDRIMLEAVVERGAARFGPFFPLNEVVIGRKNVTRLLTLKTSVNGRYLCTYRADGVIISTPTGSTGYSLSANGPILTPQLSNLILNPICPHSLASRPVILAGSDSVTVEVSGHDIAPSLSIDVQEGVDLICGDRVQIKKADAPLRLVLSARRDFFQVMREKLGWVRH